MIVKMDIRYQRNGNEGFKIFQRFRCPSIRNSDPDNICTGLPQCINLCRCIRSIHRTECTHGLYGNRCAAANLYSPYIYLSCLTH